MKFFVKNNSAKAFDSVNQTNADFLNAVQEIIVKNKVSAKAFPAILLDSNNDGERYGVFVKTPKDWNAMSIAKLLYGGCHQGTMTLAAESDNLPEEFVPAKQCLVKVEGEKPTTIIHTLQVALQQFKGDVKDFKLVLYAEEGQTYIWSVSSPGQNPLAWQKYLGRFLADLKLTPVFTEASAAILTKKITQDTAA